MRNGRAPTNSSVCRLYSGHLCAVALQAGTAAMLGAVPEFDLRLVHVSVSWDRQILVPDQQ
jgi:hypothetical protein